MDLPGLFSLLAVMILLAAIPGGSVAIVVISSASGGLRCGAAATLGIVIGDLIFVTLALLGITTLAETMGTLFAILRYLGGVYLVWFGVTLLRSPNRAAGHSARTIRFTPFRSFQAALFLTLGDLKAILFYASIFPVFVKIGSLHTGSMVIIVALTILSVGSVKLIYALLAHRIASQWQHPRLSKITRQSTGCVLIGAGGLILTRS